MRGTGGYATSEAKCRLNLQRKNGRCGVKTLANEREYELAAVHRLLVTLTGEADGR